MGGQIEISVFGVAKCMSINYFCKTNKIHMAFSNKCG
jgi:hypothetical protein